MPAPITPVRSQWDQRKITEGVTLLDKALQRSRRLGGPGPYQLQAAIAALHDEAPTAGDTDWPQIKALYARLRRHWPSPVVDLNAAVAAAMADGPAEGLAQLDLLAAAYRRALQLAHTTTERRFLTRQLSRLSQS